MKSKTWLVCILLLAGINILFFWPGELYFLNDDLLHIPLTDQGHLFQTNSVRPVHELLVRLDLFLWDRHSFGYHITALLLHLVVCLQLYDLCLLMQVRWLKIERQQAVQASLLAVVLFLAYPQSSESLAWILGRTPVLSAIFFMMTLRLFFIESYKWSFYMASAFLFAAALFTYEQSVLLPIALFGVAFLEKQKVKRTGMIMYASVLSVVDVVYTIVRKLITSEVVGGYEGSNLIAMNWSTLVANAFRIIFRLVLNPANKTAFICAAAILLVLVGSIIFLTRQIPLNRKAVAFFGGTILLLIAPVISLGLAVNSFESGRYLYLPSIFFVGGISIAAVSVFYHSKNLRRPVAVLLILVTGYWLLGKYTASQHYFEASTYAKGMEQKIQQHFRATTDTLYIDTLHLTVNRLPVFRLGFKTGINWLHHNIDTNKIIVRNYVDETR
jgi:hypothetical protein